MREFTAAAVAALGGVWVPARVHEVGAVPNTPETPYAVLSVSSGAGESYRLSAQHGSRAHRLVVQAVGSDAAEVGFAVEKAQAVFLDQRLTVPGYLTTPLGSEVASPIIRDPDGGALLTCTLTYTFNTYQES